ncbi:MULTISPECIES: hypothetical protein [Shewanella]|jgi:hypothetical protein|uniref:Uncharacterized protein n=1 Tax=Shewanella putrefaciens (strain 200) TaxID=399804 RepID=E6XG69_SHEP2|nr:MULTISPECIES: hypothetical protein [Shewanella]MCK7657679.1 hypothetical protein [Shewanella sp. JNE4-2]MDH0450999.1 hypothetical protein [Shewanella sp. GD04112]
MGVSWGNVWFQVVHQKPELNGVILLSKYPCAAGGVDENGIELTDIPVPVIEGFSFVPRDSKDDAIYHAKLKRLELTQDLIVTETFHIASYECDIQTHEYVLKHSKNKTANNHRLRTLELNQQFIDDHRKKLKGIKQIRNAKVPEFLESDLQKVK